VQRLPERGSALASPGLRDSSSGGITAQLLDDLRLSKGACARGLSASAAVRSGGTRRCAASRRPPPNVRRPWRLPPREALLASCDWPPTAARHSPRCPTTSNSAAGGARIAGGTTRCRSPGAARRFSRSRGPCIDNRELHVEDVRTSMEVRAFSSRPPARLHGHASSRTCARISPRGS
jgi:hypothetical protein